MSRILWNTDVHNLDPRPNIIYHLGDFLVLLQIVKCTASSFGSKSLLKKQAPEVFCEKKCS